jgi:cyclohexa-1,5-dienecarbonyl-CoA hydratase
MMAEQVETYCNRDDSGLRIVFSHSKGNILTGGMVAALRQALAAAKGTAALKLITLEGAGADFSFGASVAEHAPREINRVLPEMHRLVLDLLAAPAPTAAVVRGRCLGGGFELALACDLIFAADDAVLGLPEISLGVFPPVGSALLPLKVGLSRAARAVLSGQALPAADWKAAGLIDFLAPAPSLQAEVDRWFGLYLASKSAAALRHATTAVRFGTLAYLRRVLPGLERLYLKQLMRTHDATEGVAAFLEKRAPAWRNE